MSHSSSWSTHNSDSSSCHNGTTESDSIDSSSIEEQIFESGTFDLADYLDTVTDIDRIITVIHDVDGETILTSTAVIDTDLILVMRSCRSIHVDRVDTVNTLITNRLPRNVKLVLQDYDITVDGQPRSPILVDHADTITNLTMIIQADDLNIRPSIEPITKERITISQELWDTTTDTTDASVDTDIDLECAYSWCEARNLTVDIPSITKERLSLVCYSAHNITDSRLRIDSDLSVYNVICYGAYASTCYNFDRNLLTINGDVRIDSCGFSGLMVGTASNTSDCELKIRGELMVTESRLFGNLFGIASISGAYKTNIHRRTHLSNNRIYGMVVGGAKRVDHLCKIEHIEAAMRYDTIDGYGYCGTRGSTYETDTLYPDDCVTIKTSDHAITDNVSDDVSGGVNSDLHTYTCTDTHADCVITENVHNLRESDNIGGIICADSQCPHNDPATHKAHNLMEDIPSETDIERTSSDRNGNADNESEHKYVRQNRSTRHIRPARPVVNIKRRKQDPIADINSIIHETKRSIKEREKTTQTAKTAETAKTTGTVKTAKTAKPNTLEDEVFAIMNEFVKDDRRRSTDYELAMGRLDRLSRIRGSQTTRSGRRL